MRIVIVGNAMKAMVNFRGDLIADLVHKGHEVIAICPQGTPLQHDELNQLGARYVEIKNLTAKGLSFFAEFRFLKELEELLTELQVDVAFFFFLKPVIWGSFACRNIRPSIRSIGMIEGLGATFSVNEENGWLAVKRYFVQRMVKLLLRLSLPKYEKVIVLNPFDRDFLRSVVPDISDDIILVDGIGVDLQEFSLIPIRQSLVRFTFIGRLLVEKGVEIFLEVVNILAQEDVYFRLVGAIEPTQQSRLEPAILHMEETGKIEWVREVDNVIPYLADTSVLVLPTMYGEGLPRSIMEAMAVGRAVITTNVPGAKDAVTDGKSGFVIEPRDVQGLVEACQKFIDTPSLVESMGLAARKEAELRYGAEKSIAIQSKIIMGL